MQRSAMASRLVQVVCPSMALSSLMKSMLGMGLLTCQTMILQGVCMPQTSLKLSYTRLLGMSLFLWLCEHNNKSVTYRNWIRWLKPSYLLTVELDATEEVLVAAELEGPFWTCAGTEFWCCGCTTGRLIGILQVFLWWPPRHTWCTLCLLLAT